jgi:tryptophan synthase alpha chain
MDLEFYLHSRLREKEILLMTHIVAGYPSLDSCFRIVEGMVNAGVDLMELQIPFSDPMADGPVILRANQEALRGGVTVQECLDFAGKVSQAFDIPFLIMSYYNILSKYGVERFVLAMAKRDLRGTIIPDLPPEEGKEYLEAMQRSELAPIFIFSPTTPNTRMRYLADLSRGFVYCVARKGVTGAGTEFTRELTGYLGRCRKATHLPLALGFGVREKADVDYLKGKADIAVIGTQTIEIMERDGIGSVGDFILGLH